MIKADIVKKVAERLNLKDKEALQVVDTILESMKEVICAHGRLEVRDFGVFQVKERKARIGRNPRNKEEYPIPPRQVVTFKLGKELKDHSVNTANAEDGGESSPAPGETQAAAQRLSGSGAPVSAPAPGEDPQA
jgi:nucleoid DNA-binding protein